MEAVASNEALRRDMPDLRPGHGRELGRGLAMAHLRLARYAIARRAAREAVAHGMRAFRSSPRLVATRVGQRVRKVPPFRVRGARTPE